MAGFAGGFLRAEGVAFLVIETVQGINIRLGAGDNDVRVGTAARGAVFTLAQAHGHFALRVRAAGDGS